MDGLSSRRERPTVCGSAAERPSNSSRHEEIFPVRMCNKRYTKSSMIMMIIIITVIHFERVSG